MRNSQSSDGVFRWFPISRVPMDRMWADAREWFDFVLKHQKFPTDYAFLYDAKKSVVLMSRAVASRDEAKKFLRLA